MPQPRERVIPLRVNDEEYELLHRRAADLKLPVSTSIREAAVRDATAFGQGRNVPESSA